MVIIALSISEIHVSDYRLCLIFDCLLYIWTKLEGPINSHKFSYAFNIWNSYTLGMKTRARITVVPVRIPRESSAA